MKILVAFDSFKGCMTAHEACHAAAMAILELYPEAQVVEIPLSDGGEGLVEAVKMAHCNLKMANNELKMANHELRSVTIDAHGPLMEALKAEYLLSADGKTAYMEMASTSGLTLIPAEGRNPMLTTTYGVGDLIADAIHRGAETIVMGIGGSATNDGGRGMIQSLTDHNMLDGEGRIIDERLQNCHFIVACDVSNPLCGPMGASAVFGPQKGATPEMVQLLDKQLQDFASEAIAKGLATAAMMNHPGAGAAGGLGFGMMAYLGAELKSGIDILLDIVEFDKHLHDTTLVITGEGKSDEQTLMGKVPHGILKRCRQHQVPVHLYSGAIDDASGLLSKSFDQLHSINEGDDRPLQELLNPNVAMENLKKTIKGCMKI